MTVTKSRDEAYRDLVAELPEYMHETLDDLISGGDQMESALLTVKYWFHDFFYTQRVTKSSREMLRLVEEALDDT